MTLISSLFAVEYRNTGLSFCCGISYAVSGLLLVIVASIAEKGQDNVSALNYFFWLVGFVIMISVITLGVFKREVADD
jgi:hypothetical protein